MISRATKIRRGLLLSVIMLVAGMLISLAGCGNAPEEKNGKMGEEETSKEEALEPMHLTFASMAIGGNWHLYATTIAEITNPILPKGTKIEVIPEQGGTGNPMVVSNNTAQFGISFAPTQNWAFNGIGYYADRGKFENIRSVLGGMNYPDYHRASVVVRANSGIQSLKKVIEEKQKVSISTTHAGTASEVVASLLLEVYGVTYDDVRGWGGEVKLLDRTVQLQQFQDGMDDIVIMVHGAGEPNITEMAMHTDCRWLELEPEVVEALKKMGFEEFEVKAGEYRGIDEAFTTVSLPTGIIAHKDVPDEIVYKMLEAIDENIDRVRKSHASLEELSMENAWRLELNGLIPLHPGAEKFYKDKGYMD